MRTDSVELSSEAMELIKQHTIEKYGNKSYESRKYKQKVKVVKKHMKQ